MLEKIRPAEVVSSAINPVKNFMEVKHMLAGDEGKIESDRGMDLIIQKELETSLRSLKKASGSMKKHTDKLTRLIDYFQIKKKEKNAQKFLRKIVPYVRNLNNDLHLFITNYTSFLNLVKRHMETVIDMENYSVHGFQGLVRGVIVKAKQQRVVLDENLIRKIHIEIRAFEHIEIGKAKKELKDDEHVVNNDLRKPFFITYRSVLRSLKRKVSKDIKMENKEIFENREEIKRQIRDGIRQDILVRLYEHIKNMEQFHKVYNQALHDTKLLVQIAHDFIKKSINDIKILLSKFKFQQEDRIKQELKKLEEVESWKNDIMKKEFRYEKELANIINRICKGSDSLFNVMLKSSRDLVHTIENESTSDFIKDYTS